MSIRVLQADYAMALRIHIPYRRADLTTRLAAPVHLHTGGARSMVGRYGRRGAAQTAPLMSLRQQPAPYSHPTPSPSRSRCGP